MCIYTQELESTVLTGKELGFETHVYICIHTYVQTQGRMRQSWQAKNWVLKHWPITRLPWGYLPASCYPSAFAGKEIHGVWVGGCVGG